MTVVFTHQRRRSLPSFVPRRLALRFHQLAHTSNCRSASAISLTGKAARVGNLNALLPMLLLPPLQLQLLLIMPLLRMPTVNAVSQIISRSRTVRPRAHSRTYARTRYASIQTTHVVYARTHAHTHTHSTHPHTHTTHTHTYTYTHTYTTAPTLGRLSRTHPPLPRRRRRQTQFAGPTLPVCGLLASAILYELTVVGSLTPGSLRLVVSGLAAAAVAASSRIERESESERCPSEFISAFWTR